MPCESSSARPDRSGPTAGSGFPELGGSAAAKAEARELLAGPCSLPGRVVPRVAPRGRASLRLRREMRLIGSAHRGIVVLVVFCENGENGAEDVSPVYCSLACRLFTHLGCLILPSLDGQLGGPFRDFLLPPEAGITKTHGEQGASPGLGGPTQLYSDVTFYHVNQSPELVLE